MSRPPIKAMEAVKRYCEKNTTCKGCPLYFKYRCCLYSPKNWEIKKEGDEE